MKIDKDTRILIVDDYKTMLKIIRNLLKQLGREWTHARKPKQELTP